MTAPRPTEGLLLAFDDEAALAQPLAAALGWPLAYVDVHTFPDGETRLRLPPELPAQVVVLRDRASQGLPPPLHLRRAPQAAPRQTPHKRLPRGPLASRARGLLRRPHPRWQRPARPPQHALQCRHGGARM